MRTEKWTKKELRALNAFSGGKTVEEVKRTLKGKPDTRQLRNIMRKFMNARELQDLDHGQRGPVPHRYIPKSNSFGPETPSTKFVTRDLLENEDAAIADIYDDAREILTILVANRRCRTPKRIREICNQWIGPAVSDIMELRSATKRVIRFDLDLQKLHPGRFFTEEYVSTRRRKSSLEPKGILRVRHPASTSDDEWFFPTLTEWERYFERVIDEIGNIGAWYRISERVKRSEAKGQGNHEID